MNPSKLRLRCLGYLCLAALAVFTPGCQHGGHEAEGASSSQETLVRVTPIKPLREPLVRYCEQPGQISPVESAPLQAKVTGFVRRVHVDIGDAVKGPVYDGEGKLVEPGQTLVEIDVPELEKELSQKKALVAQAEAEARQAQAAIKVAKAARDSTAADLDEAKAMVDRVKADRDRWQSELARITDLADRQAVTSKLVDETQSKFRAADAAGKEVAAKIQSADARLLEAEAQVEKAEADAEAAAAKREVAVADEARTAALLKYATIHAPFDGVVAARHVDTGHLVSGTAPSKEPMLVIVRADTVRVFVDVPEVDAVYLAPNAEAQLRVASLGPDEFPGVVTRTTWVLDQATRTLRTEIDVPNPDRKLRPGMYAYARLKVADKADALTIPRTALMTSGGKSHCWKVQPDGTLLKQPLQTGIEANGKVEVLAGLSEEDAIIGVNPGAFREGQRVETVAASTK